MGDQVDAVNPDNIAHTFDHGLALRISVLADASGQCFDGETGDAGPDAVSWAVRARFVAGWWSVVYVNQSLEAAYLDAVAARGVPLRGVGEWPAPGCYEWCADPSGNVKSGGWKPRVTPVAVQDRYLGTVDLSTTFGAWPFTVAGYSDGPQSKWPDTAWARFGALADASPALPNLPDREVRDMQIGWNKEGNLIIVGVAADNGNLLQFVENPPGTWGCIDVTDATHAASPGDPRWYRIKD